MARGHGNIVAMPRGQTAVNRGGKKADEGAKPGSARESRQFSQLSDLHPCSSFTGRLLREKSSVSCRGCGGGFSALARHNARLSYVCEARLVKAHVHDSTDNLPWMELR